MAQRPSATLGVMGAEQGRQRCAVPNCARPATGFVLHGEIYIGQPQHPAQVLLCAQHVGRAAVSGVGPLRRAD
jgi:hypothetical protein